jgi:hypothetical protein
MHEQLSTTTKEPEAAPAIDDNGVRAGAESLVDTAASSSGAAMPADLQQRFESSLGADLSGVRIHVGSESATACEAVGARAYTVGNDIHFGEGHFDVGSSAGQELLAHEVAHTVQQSGGAAQGAQFKLEVSTPGDAHEIEADRAAAAMIAGEPAQVSAGVGLARRVDREALTDQMWDTANQSEEAAKQILSDPNTAPPITKVSMVTTRAQADTALSEVEAGKAAMTMANQEGTASYEQIQQNDMAEVQLTLLKDELFDQNSSLGVFIQRLDTLGLDYTRLIAEIGTLDQSDRVSGMITQSAENGTMGEAICKYGAGFDSSEAMHEDFKELSATGDVKGDSRAADGTLAEMNRLAGSLAGLQDGVYAQFGILGGAQLGVVAALTQNRITGLEQKVDSISAQIASAKAGQDAFKANLGIIQAGVGAIKTGTEVFVEPENPAVWFDVLTTVAGLLDSLAGEGNELQIQRQKTQQDIKDDTRTFNSATILKAQKDLLGAATLAKNAQDAYLSASKELANKKNEYREAMRDLGSSADRAAGAGDSYSVGAQILGEGEVFLAQSRATIDAGNLEMQKAALANGKRKGLNKFPYWYALQDRPIDGTGRLGYHVYPATVQISPYGPGSDDSGAPMPGGVEGDGGVNPAVKEALEKAEAQRSSIEGLLAPLRHGFSRK